MRVTDVAAAALLYLAAAQPSPADRPPSDGPPGSEPAPMSDAAPDRSPGMSEPFRRAMPTDPGNLRREAGPRDSTPFSEGPVAAEGSATPDLGK